jgi:hypothetical protein
MTTSQEDVLTLQPHPREASLFPSSNCMHTQYSPTYPQTLTQIHRHTLIHSYTQIHTHLLIYIYTLHALIAYGGYINYTLHMLRHRYILTMNTHIYTHTYSHTLYVHSVTISLRNSHAHRESLTTEGKEKTEGLLIPQETVPWPLSCPLSLASSQGSELFC